MDTRPVKLIRHSGSWIHYPAPFGAGDEITMSQEDFYERLSKREHGPGPAAAEWAPRPKGIITFRKIQSDRYFEGVAYFEAAVRI